ncbi:MAG: hypothetical protein JO356_19130 [Acidobacteria bacterium]|nr:hypothetical protein [Acidobacteriota bacterium]
MKRPALILGAHTIGDLRSATATLLDNPSCSQLKNRRIDCIAFVEFGAATPMLRVYLNGRPDEVPLGTPVARLLDGLTRVDRVRALASIRIQRFFRGSYLDVSFPRNAELIPRIPVYAGDKISW